MATISSHILNGVHGTHAGGVRVEGYKRFDDGTVELVFSITSGADGRITADIDVTDPNQEYELVFHTGEYFDQEGLAEESRIIPSTVFRIKLSDPEQRFHIPVIASPHGYSVWWST